MAEIKRLAIFIAAFFLVVAATLVNAYQLYFMAALLLALPLVSYGLGRLALRDLEFSREAPGTAWEGEIVPFELIVRSHSRIPRFSFQAEEDFPEWIQPGYEEPPLFNIAPNTTSRIPYPVQLLKRGAYRLDGIIVTAQDPLGLYAFRKRVSSPAEILVYPVPQDIADFGLSGAEKHGVRDLPIAATRGSGVDPDGVREYIPGDPLRRMHWKSTARTGKLNVIEFEESRAVNVVLVLDLHRGSNVGEGKETTLEYLVRAAASLAQQAIRQGASVRLVTGDGRDASSFAGRGTEHLYLVLASLARAEATDPDRLSAKLVTRVGHLSPGTTLIVLTSTLDDSLPEALSHYSIPGAKVYVIYADPSSFLPGSNTPSREGQLAFFERLYAAQTIPLIIRRNAEGRILPERTHDVPLTS